MRLGTGTVASIVFACVVAFVSAVEAETDGASLISALKEGGYVIYLRHSMSDTAKPDRDPIVVGDCATQRPLSEEGRAHARAIGRVFKAAGVKVDRVLSSSYCRAAETAALAFPEIAAKQVPMLFYSLALPKDEAVRAADELKRELAVMPNAEMNTAMVGHTSNVKEAAGAWPKKEGSALIFRPDGKGAFAFVGSIDPADFTKFGD